MWVQSHPHTFSAVLPLFLRKKREELIYSGTI